MSSSWRLPPGLLASVYSAGVAAIWSTSPLSYMTIWVCESETTWYSIRLSLAGSRHQCSLRSRVIVPVSPGSYLVTLNMPEVTGAPPFLTALLEVVALEDADVVDRGL